MTMLITLGMFTNVTYPHGVGSNDSLVTQDLTQTDSVSEINARFTLQLAHHLPAVHLTSAEQPQHHLQLTIKFVQPLSEHGVFDVSFLGFTRFILLYRASLHSG